LNPVQKSKKTLGLKTPPVSSHSLLSGGFPSDYPTSSHCPVRTACITHLANPVYFIILF